MNEMTVIRHKVAGDNSVPVEMTRHLTAAGVCSTLLVATTGETYAKELQARGHRRQQRRMVR
jgi:hypothetical protein